MSQRRSLRFPIFAKILIACGTLATLLVLGSFSYTKHQIEKQGRGKYLQKHFNRYTAYQLAVGKAIAGAVAVVAQDAELALALAAKDGTAAAPTTPPATPKEADDAKPGEQETDDDAKPAPLPAPAPRAGPSIEQLAKQKLRSLRTGMAALLRDKDPANPGAGRPPILPDVFVIFDGTGTAAFLYTEGELKVDAQDIPNLQAVRAVLRGRRFAHELVIHADQVFQAAGVPIEHDGKIVGGIIFGVSLQRYFVGYRRQSDESMLKQHRLTLVSDKKVLASTFNKSRPELFQAITTDEKKTTKDGRETIEIIEYDGAPWDFWTAPVSGFTDTKHTEQLGVLCLMRTRSAVKQTEQMHGLLFAAGLGLVLSLIFASGLAFILTRPIKRFILSTREIAGGAGDLTQRIALSGNDELTDLADNINSIFENLQRVAQEVLDASLHVSSVSAELCAVSRSMNDGAKGQSEKLDDAAARVYELSRSISEVASNATDATTAALQADTAVAAAEAKMTEIQSSSEDAKTRMQELGESVKRIGNIVGVIQQISEQTSLLALNASIEAAHAGEQGRGFAVVADEVSSLARRVGQSAKDIEDRVGAIREQTTEAVLKMEKGSAEVESGTELVTGTLTNLKNIVDAVQRTAHQVEEQAHVSDGVSKDVDEVKRFATEVLDSSEQVLSEGDRLHRLAEQLSHSVRGFKTNEGSPKLTGGDNPVLALTPALPETSPTETEAEAPAESEP